MKPELCKIADIPETGSLLAPFFGRELHIHRAGGRLRAATNVGLHFDGPLECRDGKFVRPWHDAALDMASGERQEGPAPASSRLMLLPTRVENETLAYVWGA